MNYSDKIIRAATIENMADFNGIPDVKLLTDLYKNISAKTIITGFVYVSENGRAMQPRQAGIINETQVKAWAEIAAQVKKNDPQKELIMQLAHTGRQTTRKNAVGASTVKCTYFKNKVKALSENEIKTIITDFKNAALSAQAAGFDGVQLHAAHGYLIHQFLSPYTNKRTDKYAQKTLLLKEIIYAVRGACGHSFKIWLKVSHGDDRGMNVNHAIEIVKEVAPMVDAVEISYGTMEYPLNIIRGAVPIDVALQVNPLFNKYPKWVKSLWKKFVGAKYKNKFFPFTKNYNLAAALEIKKAVKTPIILTGGVRNAKDIKEILDSGIDKISLCRPFICEPGLMNNFNETWQSACTNCNLCAIYCDSENSVKCYKK
ncbi:4-dienoyl-CoA reductase-like NADH-dependent reductase (Old Yellow Enzyme family) [Elusimicrobium posterum]|uniref:NADH:flavin oxidoreductase n=1 Tax=Elusimicrobium posterum TaxID=3116653 RepID=UPI003C73B504